MRQYLLNHRREDLVENICREDHFQAIFEPFQLFRFAIYDPITWNLILEKLPSRLLVAEKRLPAQGDKTETLVSLLIEADRVVEKASLKALQDLLQKRSGVQTHGVSLSTREERVFGRSLRDTKPAGEDNYLHLAVKHQKPRVLELLLQYGTAWGLDPNRTREFCGSTVLHLASDWKGMSQMASRLEMVRILLRSSFSAFDALDKRGRSALSRSMITCGRVTEHYLDHFVECDNCREETKSYLDTPLNPVTTELLKDRRVGVNLREHFEDNFSITPFQRMLVFQPKALDMFLARPDLELVNFMHEWCSPLFLSLKFSPATFEKCLTRFSASNMLSNLKQPLLPFVPLSMPRGEERFMDREWTDFKNPLWVAIKQGGLPKWAVFRHVYKRVSADPLRNGALFFGTKDNEDEEDDGFDPMHMNPLPVVVPPLLDEVVASVKATVGVITSSATFWACGSSLPLELRVEIVCLALVNDHYDALNAVGNNNFAAIVRYLVWLVRSQHRDGALPEASSTLLAFGVSPSSFPPSIFFTSNSINITSSKKGSNGLGETLRRGSQHVAALSKLQATFTSENIFGGSTFDKKSSKISTLDPLEFKPEPLKPATFVPGSLPAGSSLRNPHRDVFRVLGIGLNPAPGLNAKPRTAFFSDSIAASPKSVTDVRLEENTNAGWAMQAIKIEEMDSVFKFGNSSPATSSPAFSAHAAEKRKLKKKKKKTRKKNKLRAKRGNVDPRDLARWLTLNVAVFLGLLIWAITTWGMSPNLN